MHALLIDHEQGALGGAVATEDAVARGHLAVRPEIGQRLEVEPAHRDRPGMHRRHVVGGDAEQDRVVLLEEVERDVVARPLLRADRGEGGGHEREHHVLAARGTATARPSCPKPPAG